VPLGAWVPGPRCRGVLLRPPLCMPGSTFQVLGSTILTRQYSQAVCLSSALSAGL